MLRLFKQVTAFTNQLFVCNVLLIRKLGEPQVQHVQQGTVHIWFDIKAHNAANLHTQVIHINSQNGETFGP